MGNKKGDKYVGKGIEIADENVFSNSVKIFIEILKTMVMALNRMKLKMMTRLLKIPSQSLSLSINQNLNLKNRPQSQNQKKLQFFSDKIPVPDVKIC
jgi:hypothetical protein